MRTNLRRLMTVLALATGVHGVQAKMSLGIAVSGGQSILHWSAMSNGTNGVLQSATRLSPANWQMTTDAVSVNYTSQIAVAVTNTDSAHFYRLSLVPPTSDGMAMVPAGAFTIGDTLDGMTNAAPTNVYVSAFYMDTNLVTLAQWKTVYNYATNHGYQFDSPGFGKNTNQPVELVNWYDAVKWCNARSQKAGLAPVYYTDAALTQLYTNGENDAIYVNWATNGYRLPTEAEWEKAARGGLIGMRFPWGNMISETQANYYATNTYNYDQGPNGFNPIGSVGGNPNTSPVGSFPPNSYGLYDMAGNVYEWTWDWYNENLKAAGSPYAGGTDPHGPASGTYSSRVRRGGSWKSSAPVARCAFRSSASPIFANNDLGFRCVRAATTK